MNPARHSDPERPSDLLTALADPATYPGHPRVSVHETHASWVFVAGERAYKVKKPLALGFLDYSTLALRRAACREEVRVNRELAPDIYLGVRAIVANDGGFRFAEEATPGAVEYCVEMRTFEERETLAGLIAAGALTSADLRAVARRVAEFHRSARVVSGWQPRDVLALWSKNVGELRAVGPPPEWDIGVVEGFGAAFVAAHTPELRERAHGGLIRDCHGDLRCEHVLPGPPVRVVDRIEFDPALRRVDVARDLAFLAMELEALDRRWAARELIAAYRETGPDPGSAALRAFYAAHCALVRTKVALIAAGERAGAEEGQAWVEGQAQADAHERSTAQTQRLWELAERLCWRAREPLALVICGPAASGKSTLGAELARRAGLQVVSSDAVRKRLGGLRPHERGAAELYSADFTRETYAELGREALRVLVGGGVRGPGVIVDATCRARVDRAPLLEALRGSGARLLAVRCQVPPALALERAQRRVEDPSRVSDATPAVVATQLAEFEELGELPAECVLGLDTARSLAAQVAAVVRALDERLRPGDAEA